MLSGITCGYELTRSRFRCGAIRRAGLCGSVLLRDALRSRPSDGLLCAGPCGWRQRSEVGAGEVDELPGKGGGRRLGVDEREVAAHGQVLPVDDPQHAAAQAVDDRDDRDDGHRVAVADEGLDPFGRAEPHDHVQLREADARRGEGRGDDLERAGPLLAQDERDVPQGVGRERFGAGVFAARAGDEDQFVVCEERVVEPLPAAHALDDAQVDGVLLERVFDLAAVAREHRNADAREAGGEAGEDRRQQVLGDGRAGAQTQLALGLTRAEAHLVLHAAVIVEDALRGVEQRAPRIGELQAAAAPVEELDPVAALQLPDVLADGRLRDAQLFGGPGEAQRPGRRDEDLEAEVVHGISRGVPPRRTP